MHFAQWNRVIHRWATVLVAVPLVIVILTGLLLMMKKNFSWIQPESMRGKGTVPSIEFEHILKTASAVECADISTWDDINRLDVRPSKGMVKIQAESGWEIQVDTKTGEILQVAYRRSDLIESLHDGSFFGDPVKYWIFIPSGIVLLAMLLTGLYLFGLYLFVIPFKGRSRRRRKSKCNDV